MTWQRQWWQCSDSGDKQWWHTVTTVTAATVATTTAVSTLSVEAKIRNQSFGGFENIKPNAKYDRNTKTTPHHPRPNTELVSSQSYVSESSSGKIRVLLCDTEPTAALSSIPWHTFPQTSNANGFKTEGWIDLVEFREITTYNFRNLEDIASGSKRETGSMFLKLSPFFLVPWLEVGKFEVQLKKTMRCVSFKDFHLKFVEK